MYLTSQVPVHPSDVNVPLPRYLYILLMVYPSPQVPVHSSDASVPLRRYLYIPLMTVERAWSYAMQLKQEANTEHRKKYHLASRLRKAAQLVDLFQKLTDEVRKEKGEAGGVGGRARPNEGRGRGTGRCEGCGV